MFRLRLYQRYLMRETFAAIFLVLAAFIALFSFFDLINELRSVGKGGYQFGHAVIFVALSLPGLIYELIPIAALIGTLYALSTLARHSEITVLRASGLAASRPRCNRGGHGEPSAGGQCNAGSARKAGIPRHQHKGVDPGERHADTDPQGQASEHRKTFEARIETWGNRHAPVVWEE